MLRKEIQAALEAAAAISIHHEFVVAGSLSVLGLLVASPELMAVSIDIDFYPLRDPEQDNRGQTQCCSLNNRNTPIVFPI